jgi:hypothetical protein
MLDVTEAFDLIDEIVNEKPFNYKYTEDPKRQETIERSVAQPSNACFYAHYDGTPGCIVGTLIHKLNPEFDLKSIETLLVGSALKRAGIEATQNAIQFLSFVQNEQDRGSTWRHSAEYGKCRV